MFSLFRGASTAMEDYDRMVEDCLRSYPFHNGEATQEEFVAHMRQRGYRPITGEELRQQMAAGKRLALWRKLDNFDEIQRTLVDDESQTSLAAAVSNNLSSRSTVEW